MTPRQWVAYLAVLGLVITVAWFIGYTGILR